MAGMYADDYPEVAERSDAGDRGAGQGGEGVPADAAQGHQADGGLTPQDGITGTELFTLYDTFGFPVELSTEEARLPGHHRSAEQWRAEFDEKMAEQRSRSQQASKMKI